MTNGRLAEQSAFQVLGLLTSDMMVTILTCILRYWCKAANASSPDHRIYKKRQALFLQPTLAINSLVSCLSLPGARITVLIHFPAKFFSPDIK